MGGIDGVSCQHLQVLMTHLSQKHWEWQERREGGPKRLCKILPRQFSHESTHPTTCVDDRVLVRRPPVLGLVALRSCLNLRYHFEAPGGAHDIGRLKGARDIAPPTASPFGHRCTVCGLPGPTGVMTPPGRMMSHQSANSVRAVMLLMYAQCTGSCVDTKANFHRHPLRPCQPGYGRPMDQSVMYTAASLEVKVTNSARCSGLISITFLLSSTPCCVLNKVTISSTIDTSVDRSALLPLKAEMSTSGWALGC